eukprot:6373658-Karenia_brevis.AAC.1
MVKESGLADPKKTAKAPQDSSILDISASPFEPEVLECSLEEAFEKVEDEDADEDEELALIYSMDWSRVKAESTSQVLLCPKLVALSSPPGKAAADIDR